MTDTTVQDGTGAVGPVETAAPPVEPVGPVLPPPKQASFFVKLLVVAFALAYTTLTFYLIVDVWALNSAAIRRLFGIAADAELPPLFVPAVYAVLGAMLGAGALDITSFHRYAAIKRDFQQPHVWGYFLGPWLAAILGLIVFALLQTGLLVFSAGRAEAAAADGSNANLGYLVVGFLSGFGWYNAIQRIREIVTRFFSAASDSARRDANVSTAPPAPPATPTPGTTADRLAGAPPSG